MYLEGTVREPGQVITESNAAKLQKYRADCSRADNRFIPIAFHFLGGIFRVGKREENSVAVAMVMS